MVRLRVTTCSLMSGRTACKDDKALNMLHLLAKMFSHMAANAGEEMVNEGLDRDPKEVTFTPRRPASIRSHANKNPPFLRSHREKGMEGELEVVE